jgi:hypothetical protein
MVKSYGYLNYLHDHTRHLFSIKTEEKIAIFMGILAIILLIYKIFNDIIPNIYEAIVLKKYQNIGKIFI